MILIACCRARVRIKDELYAYYIIYLVTIDIDKSQRRSRSADNRLVLYLVEKVWSRNFYYRYYRALAFPLSPHQEEGGPGTRPSMRCEASVIATSKVFAAARVLISFSNQSSSSHLLRISPENLSRRPKQPPLSFPEQKHHPKHGSN